MARLHLDQHVSHHIAAELRIAGHDVVTAYEIGPAAADDDVHLLHASREDRIFLTHNADDFLLLHKAWVRWTHGWDFFRQHSGILVCPQAPVLRPSVVVGKVLELLGGIDRIDNELWAYDKDSGIWRLVEVPL